jgi:hypothetical protein
MRSVRGTVFGCGLKVRSHFTLLSNMCTSGKQKDREYIML